MADYKVVKEEGIVLEGEEAVHEKDSVLVLDAEAEQTKQLLEDGSIVAVEEENGEEEKKVEDEGASTSAPTTVNGARHELA